MHTIGFTTMNPMADFHVVHSHVMGYFCFFFHDFISLFPPQDVKTHNSLILLSASASIIAKELRNGGLCHSRCRKLTPTSVSYRRKQWMPNWVTKVQWRGRWFCRRMTPAEFRAPLQECPLLLCLLCWPNTGQDLVKSPNGLTLLINCGMLVYMFDTSILHKFVIVILSIQLQLIMFTYLQPWPIIFAHPYSTKLI